MMPDFECLFTPIRIGSRTIKNRICCSGHADALAEDGMPADRERRYYEEKAIGGVGFMMCFGSASVHPTSTARDWNGVEVFDDRVIPYLQKFSDTMHQYDVPVCCQITHRGRRGRSIDLWNRMYGPSDVREPNHRENPHPLDEGMIDELVEAFAAAARRLQLGGFDGCEIMASHCHLIDQFWTLNANRRDDQYGANSIESRMKFGVRVIEAVRERVGSDFIVGTRITGDDLTERGLDNSQMQEICGRLNDLKMLDYFNVIGGSAETFAGEAAAVPNMSFKLGLYTYLAASIRQVVDVPVITFGRIVDPVQADKILIAGDADLVIMNRALIADPHFPNKAQAGQLDDIRQCMGYNEGCIDRIYTGRGVTCVQNPVIGREAEWAKLTVLTARKTIVVVGGGPAGLEAARVSAAQGQRVILFEKSAELGGQTLIAKHAPGRQDFDGATRWSGLQCQKLGVDIRLNTAANVDTIADLKPDRVFVATGATARPHGLEMSEGHHVVSAWDVLLGTAGELGKTILLIDEEYGHQGPTTAALLLERGHEVDLITSQETIGNFLGATTRPPVLTRLFKLGIQMFCHLKAMKLENGRCIAANQWTGELFQVGPYDGFVYAYGGISDDRLSAPLRERGLAVEVIGDAFAPRSLQHAILEGHQFARDDSTRGS
jgi:2,4-dienoyl-CoA reductase-like NADH-dependent reductase (Old Yellow Enzyme family)